MQVKKGPRATGSVFGFRYGTGKGGSERLEAGDKPVKVPAMIEDIARGYCNAGFLEEVADGRRTKAPVAATADDVEATE